MLRHRFPFTYHDKKIIIYSLVKTLNYLHSNKIIHRDIKPENIIFRNKLDFKSAVISDFGLSVIS